MRLRRIRQANLMGPAGFVSVDDSEVIKFAQDSMHAFPYASGVMEMGGRDWQESESHMVTEGAIRSFYDYYRRVMEL
jgi:anthranilate 1,2-dioxygenase large subunit